MNNKNGICALILLFAPAKTKPKKPRRKTAATTWRPSPLRGTNPCRGRPDHRRVSPGSSSAWMISSGLSQRGGSFIDFHRNKFGLSQDQARSFQWPTRPADEAVDHLSVLCEVENDHVGRNRRQRTDRKLFRGLRHIGAKLYRTGRFVSLNKRDFGEHVEGQRR